MGEKKTEETNQYLTFILAGEGYAIPVTRVREVLLVPKITKIPRMPEFMRGVFNLRGMVVPIVDLKKKFGLGETDLTSDTAIIVIEIHGAGETHDGVVHIGLFADIVQKVITIPDAALEPPPKIGMRVNTSFIMSMGHVENDFIVILNIEEILTAKELERVETASEVPVSD